MKRRLSALLLAVLLVTTLIPGVVSAAASEVSLSEAVQLAKAAFPEVSFPAEFTSNYGESAGQGTWYLRWYTKADKYSEVTVNVNGTTGEIVGFNWYAEPDANQTYAPLPKLTQEDSRKLAEAFLQKLIPGKLGECQYQEEVPPRPLLSNRNWQQRYYFQFVRQVNGISCPANGISVTVDGDTGAIVSYGLNWNDLTFPSLDGIISSGKAAEILKEKGALELQYIWPYVEQGETAKPMLAYTYPSINNLYIDAHTGELANDGYIIYSGSLQKTEGRGAADSAYTPQEWAEIEYVQGLLTKEQAEAKARELLGIAAKLQMTQARLAKDSSFPDLRTWQISFQSEADREYYDVRLDAKTGELYHVSHYWAYDESLSAGTLTPEQAKVVAEAFMQKYSSAKASRVELVSMPTKDGEQNSVYYYFSYRRMVNGVPFPSNYINVSVRAEKTGFVTDYDVRWVEAEFPDPTQALAKTAAYDKLLTQYPLQQEYRLVHDTESDKAVAIGYSEKVSAISYVESAVKAVLTYRLENTASTLFSADQMLPIDYHGKVITAEKPGVPQDVDGNPAKGDITFLAKVGIIKLDNGLYHPTQNMTVGEWLEMLSRATGWTTDNPIIVLPQWAKAAEDKPFAGAAQAAIAAGLILPGENVDMSKALTRENLALFAVRALGYEKVASIPGIYQLNCQDAKAVSAKQVGHVAIARGLGILVGDATHFYPQNSASKAECAVVVMRMLRMER